MVQSARATTVAGQVRLIAGLNSEIGELDEVVAANFGRHPDADIYASQPDLGVGLGARVLAESGDTDRFADAKARENYAGTSPITRASGRKKIVLARHIRNRRLGDAVRQWAFCALKGSPGGRAYFNALCAGGMGHQAALRQVGDQLVGILHDCLKTRTLYDERTAWEHHLKEAA
jgi:transposase